MEATGGLEHEVAAALAAAGLPVAVVTPRPVRDFARTTGQEAIEQSPAWRADDDLLRRVPGIRPVVSAPLVAKLPELGRLSSKEIAALVGIAPFNRDSGTLRGKRAT